MPGAGSISQEGIAGPEHGQRNSIETEEGQGNRMEEAWKPQPYIGHLAGLLLESCAWGSILLWKGLAVGP